MVGLIPMEGFKEQAVLLGPRRSLVGVIAEGASPARAERPTVIILNSGIVHRVGANRMSVPLSRALAAAGHTVVRFDLSGIGDSAPRTDALSPLEASLADIREVLDSLCSARPARRFILAGLCSGADHALLCAREDPRVVGAVLLDPSLPHTWWHHVCHYRNRLLRTESWLNVVRGRNPLWRALKARVAGARPEAQEPRQRSLQDPAVREFLEAAYRDALENGTRFLAVLTGERSYYREQLTDAFPRVPFGDRLRVEYFEDSDHMFSAQQDSARLIRLIAEWAQRTDFTGSVDEAHAGRRSGGRHGAC